MGREARRIKKRFCNDCKIPHHLYTTAKRLVNHALESKLVQTLKEAING